MQQARVAVVQAGSSMFETPRTLERMEAFCDELRRERADLAVFPEAYVGGYPKGLDFGARVGSRSAEGRDAFLRYWSAAIDVPGPETRRLGELAVRAGAHLMVGVVERDRGTLYCTTLFLAPSGELLGKHRKVMPTASERLVWGFGDASTLAAFETPFGTVGSAICWEHYMPALRMALYARGVSLWCASTVDDRDMWQVTMRHVAYEGRCFVASACQYLTRADCPPGYACIQGDDPQTVLIRGGSVVVGPLGDVLAGPLYGREGVLAATVDVEDCVRGKYDLDVAGHYARPDLFTLSVDSRPRPAVAFGEPTPPPVRG